MKPRNCTNCGASLPPGAHTCKYCGQSFEPEKRLVLREFRNKMLAGEMAVRGVEKVDVSKVEEGDVIHPLPENIEGVNEILGEMKNREWSWTSFLMLLFPLFFSLMVWLLLHFTAWEANYFFFTHFSLIEALLPSLLVTVLLAFVGFSIAYDWSNKKQYNGLKNKKE